MDSTTVVETVRVVSEIIGLNIANCTMYILAGFGVAQIIARVTPTKKDDEIVGKIGKFINAIFLKSNTR